MIQVHIAGIGLCGPGMEDWTAGRAVLRGETPLERHTRQTGGGDPAPCGTAPLRAGHALMPCRWHRRP